MATAPYFISEDQFVGLVNLDFGKEEFPSSFAIEVEENICINLLGYDLWTALIADLSDLNVPNTQKYRDLVDGISTGYTDNSEYLKRLKGIKEMLKYFFFATYQSYLQSHQTQIGEFEFSAENSIKSGSGLNNKFVYAYNLGVVYYYELINFINYKNSSEGQDYYNNFHYELKCKTNVFGI